MVSGSMKAASFLIMVMFVMMILGPLASIATWAVGLVVAALLVPIILLLGMSYTRRRAEERGGEMLDYRGWNEEEWTERLDPDDFEGEID